MPGHLPKNTWNQSRGGRGGVIGIAIGLTGAQTRLSELLRRCWFACRSRQGHISSSAVRPLRRRLSGERSVVRSTGRIESRRCALAMQRNPTTSSTNSRRRMVARRGEVVDPAPGYGPPRLRPPAGGRACRTARGAPPSAEVVAAGRQPLRSVATTPSSYCGKRRQVIPLSTVTVTVSNCC